jgi:hypothetical protein
VSAAHARHLHVVGDAERHAGERRQRSEPIDRLADYAIGAVFVVLLVLNLAAWGLGWVHLVARFFGG